LPHRRSPRELKAYDLYLQDATCSKQSRCRGVGQAITLFEQAIEKDSNLPRLRRTGGCQSPQLWRNQGQYLGAKAVLAAQQAERLSNTRLKYSSLLALFYTTTGRNAQAVAELKKALALAPNSA